MELQFFYYVWLFNDDVNSPASHRKCISEKCSRQNEQVRSHGGTVQIQSNTKKRELLKNPTKIEEIQEKNLLTN